MEGFRCISGRVARLNPRGMVAEIDVVEIDAVKFCRRELGFRINGDDAASAWQMWTTEAAPMAGLHGKDWGEAADLQLR
ncbi:hypothetical protein M0R45_030024 [Rubus argutus]|uniref:Uncharacterized protein n=1 Tax=Rubus argutus TaxID=59490 RepID=A0AAW1WCC0_RUBAR